MIAFITEILAAMRTTKVFRMPGFIQCSDTSLNERINQSMNSGWHKATHIIDGFIAIMALGRK